MGGSAVSAQGRLGMTGSARSVKADPRENGARGRGAGKARETAAPRPRPYLSSSVSHTSPTRSLSASV